MLAIIDRFPNIKSFVSQLVAVASAFSITMLVEKCEQKAEDRLHELSYLQQVHADLQKDTAEVGANIRALETVRYQYTGILKGNRAKAIGDSLGAYVKALQYTDDFEANDVAYTEIVSSGKLAIIHDDSLLNHICAYYKFADKELARANESDRRFAADHVEPFVMDRFPVAINGYDNMPEKQKATVKRTLVESNSLRSLVQTNLNRKTNKQAVYQAALEKQQELLARIDKSLMGWTK